VILNNRSSFPVDCSPHCLNGQRSTISGHRVLAHLLCFAVLITAVAFMVIFVDSQVIEIRGPGLFYPVENGDTVTHAFVHSMYDVPVFERFRIENAAMHLFHVNSVSDAALEYYGIENRHESNVDRRITEFCIPIDSIGSHVLFIGNHAICLYFERSQTAFSLNPGEHRICVRLSRRPAVINWVNSLWR
jgi:hypothetical protein